MEWLFILVILIACPLMHVLMMRKGAGCGSSHKEDKERVKDPVCGMEKTKSEFKFSDNYKDKTYYFCSKQCLEMFEGFPRGYMRE